jgi:hypothetical protein
MAPLFAACAMALTVWHAHVVSEVNDDEIVANSENPEAVELVSGLN